MRIKDFLHIKGGFGGQFVKLSEKENLLVCENGSFCGQREKACANEGLLYVKGQFLRTVFKLSVNENLLFCGKEQFFSSCKAIQ